MSGSLVFAFSIWGAAAALLHGGGGAKDSGLRKLLTLLRIMMVWCSQKRFRASGPLEGSLLRNFEEAWVVNHGTSGEKAVGRA